MLFLVVASTANNPQAAPSAFIQVIAFIIAIFLMLLPFVVLYYVGKFLYKIFFAKNKHFILSSLGRIFSGIVGNKTNKQSCPISNFEYELAKSQLEDPFSVYLLKLEKYALELDKKDAKTFKVYEDSAKEQLLWGKYHAQYFPRLMYFVTSARANEIFEATGRLPITIYRTEDFCYEADTISNRDLNDYQKYLLFPEGDSIFSRQQSELYRGVIKTNPEKLFAFWENPRASIVNASKSIIKFQTFDLSNHEVPCGVKSQWFMPKQTVVIKGHEISGGFIYVGEQLLDLFSNSPCLIEPKLDVAPGDFRTDYEKEQDFSVKYYAHLQPQQRGAYLQWLSGTRSDPQTAIFYVYLYFYGLERRLLVDCVKGEVSETERADIVSELKRLVKIYGDNCICFRNSVYNLLALEWVLFRNNEEFAEDFCNLSNVFRVSLLRIKLSKMVKSEELIPPELMLQWIKILESFYIRTPGKRCPNQFKTLFCSRYTEKYGNGIIAPSDGKTLVFPYYAASGWENSVQFSAPQWLDPILSPEQFEEIKQLIIECTDKLDKYSRYLGRNLGNINPIVALSLLPLEIRQNNPTLLEAKTKLVAMIHGQYGRIKLTELYSIFNVDKPASICKKDYEILAALFDGMNLIFAPDARFHNDKPNINGEMVFACNNYRLNADNTPNVDTSLFENLCISIKLSSIVWWSEDISKANDDYCEIILQNETDISSEERNSLFLYSYYCLCNPQKETGLKKIIKEKDISDVEFISRKVISAVFAHGNEDDKKVIILRKLFPKVGIDSSYITNNNA